jgi:hypothetical protein
VALVSTRGPVYWPPIDNPAANGQAPTIATFALDASGEKLAYIVTIWKPGILHKVYFRTATVATGDTLKVSFQNVDDTTGDPDGTPDQYRTIVVGNGDDNVALQTGILSSDGTDNGTKRTVVAGERLAIVFEFDSFVAGNILLTARSAAAGPGSSGQIYSDHFTAAWVKSANLPMVALEYSDGSYGPIPYVDPSVSGMAAEVFASDDTPDERGLIFQAPFSAKVMGFWANVDIDADADVVLYDSDGTTPLETYRLDSNVRQATHSLPYHVPISTEVTLTKDTNYRLTLKPASTTDVGLMVGNVPAAAVMDAYSGGQECHYTARTDGGAWAETTTKRPFMGLILSALDNGVSSGGAGGTGAISRSRLRRMA